MMHHDFDQTKEIIAIGQHKYEGITELVRGLRRAGAEHWTLRGIHPEAAKAKFQECAQVSSQLQSARNAARDEFARLNGWRFGKAFTLPQLREARGVRRRELDWPPNYTASPFVDFADYFWKDGKPIAIVAHVYRAWSECLAFAEREDLRADALPASWHYPTDTLAVCYQFAFARPRMENEVMLPS